MNHDTRVDSQILFRTYDRLVVIVVWSERGRHCSTEQPSTAIAVSVFVGAAVITVVASTCEAAKLAFAAFAAASNDTCFQTAVGFVTKKTPKQTNKRTTISLFGRCFDSLPYTILFMLPAELYLTTTHFLQSNCEKCAIASSCAFCPNLEIKFWGNIAGFNMYSFLVFSFF